MITIIDNNSQTVRCFKTIKEFREYCKKQGIKPKKSWREDTYYIDSFVILPTGFKD